MKRFITALAVAATLAVWAAPVSEYPFNNTKLSDDERVDNLLSLLTLDEKIALLSTDLGVPRLGVPHC